MPRTGCRACAPPLVAARVGVSSSCAAGSRRLASEAGTRWTAGVDPVMSPGCHDVLGLTGLETGRRRVVRVLHYPGHPRPRGAMPSVFRVQYAAPDAEVFHTHRDCPIGRRRTRRCSTRTATARSGGRSPGRRASAAARPGVAARCARRARRCPTPGPTGRRSATRAIAGVDRRAQGGHADGPGAEPGPSGFPCQAWRSTAERCRWNAGTTHRDESSRTPPSGEHWAVTRYPIAVLAAPRRIVRSIAGRAARGRNLPCTSRRVAPPTR
jgi:hypothetical protein